MLVQEWFKSYNIFQLVLSLYIYIYIPISQYINSKSEFIQDIITPKQDIYVFIIQILKVPKNQPSILIAELCLRCMAENSRNKKFLHMYYTVIISLLLLILGYAKIFYQLSYFLRKCLFENKVPLKNLHKIINLVLK